MVKPRQLKLLVILKQKLSINLLFFLNSLLHDIADKIKRARHLEAIVIHHGLIKLIVSHSLAKQNFDLG